ncbi:hypothetical protein PQE70_gp121 [Bacillus phage vB_BanS_Nate]|uniref:Uncharacterized protein n=1 Tax=Bacillus phage vB_BanS_Nate TaxID=2894788 RepID=A0AAE8YXW4_9CAUD|nr:hypothetical protein PQE70_gp121 [Bacillus phage vB_BanS_Nate]UGO50974.1 hypothetical protein NATE_121 [Bacillus phage vB_BanS_Nate]
MTKIETARLQMILANIRTLPQINMTKENRDTLTSIILELIKARHIQEDLIELLQSADEKIDELEWALFFAKKDEILQKVKEGR